MGQGYGAERFQGDARGILAAIADQAMNSPLDPDQSDSQARSMKGNAAEQQGSRGSVAGRQGNNSDHERNHRSQGRQDPLGENGRPSRMVEPDVEHLPANDADRAWSFRAEGSGERVRRCPASPGASGSRGLATCEGGEG